MSQLVNIYRNKETLSYQSLTNSGFSNSIDLTHDSCYFGNQDPISAYQFELDQILTFENPIDSLTSYPFPEIELENACDHEPQLGNSVSLFDSMWTSVSLPHFNPFSESTLDPVSIHREIESPIFFDQQIELDQFHTFECPIDILPSSHSYEIELNKECDFDPQICDPVQIPESLLTPVMLPNLSNILAVSYTHLTLPTKRIV